MVVVVWTEMFAPFHLLPVPSNMVRLDLTPIFRWSLTSLSWCSGYFGHCALYLRLLHEVWTSVHSSSQRTNTCIIGNYAKVPRELHAAYMTGSGIWSRVSARPDSLIPRESFAAQPVKIVSTSMTVSSARSNLGLPEHEGSLSEAPFT